MSEVAPNTPEQNSTLKPQEVHKGKESSEISPNNPDTRVEQSVDQLNQIVDDEAKSKEDISFVDSHSETVNNVSPRDLKQEAFRNTMESLRSRLNPASRVFSKLIHKPYVEAMSDAAGKTISRPSGILGGGTFAAIGSFVALYMAKRYGFTYNISLFFVLFALGYLIGLMTEAIIKLFRRNSDIQ